MSLKLTKRKRDAEAIETLARYQQGTRKPEKLVRLNNPCSMGQNIETKSNRVWGNLGM